MERNGSRTKAARLPSIAMATLLSFTFASAQAQGENEVSKGQRFYEKICAKCHEAGIGPVLLGRGLPEVVFMTIPRTGFRAMPAFRISDIDDDTLHSLATYLANSKPKQ